MTIMIRTCAFVAGWAAFLAAGRAWGEPGDANIGLGLLAFGLVVAAAAGWGFVDGTRTEYPRLALTWAAVGFLMGVLVPIFTALTESGAFDAGVLMSDLVTGLPFVALLVATPALACGAAGSLYRSRERH